MTSPKLDVRVFVEGGGAKNAALRASVRQHLGGFLERGLPNVRKPRVVRCGSREDTFTRFMDSVRDGKVVSVLLVDAEGPVQSKDARSHLKKQDRWSIPDSVTDDQLHLMVQCMEAWIVADREGAARFFKNGWDGSQLKSRSNVEGIAKDELLRRLRAATKACNTQYAKGEVSFRALGSLDPGVVREALPHAERLFAALERLLM